MGERRDVYQIRVIADVRYAERIMKESSFREHSTVNKFIALLK